MKPFLSTAAIETQLTAILLSISTEARTILRIGDDALANDTTGSNNIALGENAGDNNQRGNYNIDIGNIGYQDDSRVIRIGAFGVHTATFIAGISGVTVPNG